jgi:hypothetical protein
MATRFPKRTDEFRSGLEATLATQMTLAGVAFEYEPKDKRVRYVSPAMEHKYHPDFVMDNGIYIEAKGRFTLADRTKHLLIKQQVPDIDIRFVFSRSAAKIATNSKTTYADWCNKHGFQYADKLIPQEWFHEYRTEGSVRSKALRARAKRGIRFSAISVSGW